MRHDEKKKSHYGKTAWRLMKYVAGTFRAQFVAVFAAILISALAGTAGPLFLMYLINDFITPMPGAQSPDFSGLFKAVLALGGLYYVGVLCTYIYNRLMVNVGQGVLKRIRDEVFAHMQTLPIGYFDRHSHGELMSLYTNDTDTLRQMISQSIPQVFSSFVTAAARLSNADSFIRLLPDGYDTVITGDGEGLSQGQRQLLSIARAAVADPPVLILDEATSSIDTRTEALVQSGMDALMNGRTVFVIAHRLSTIRNSNAILVLEHGRIIERGTHQELLDKKGTYYQLYTGLLELS